MAWLLKFVGGLQGQLVILAFAAVSSFGSGWYVCSKFNDAAQFRTLQKAVNGLAQDAQSKLDTLDTDWRKAVDKAVADLDAASKLRQEDSDREVATLQQLASVQSEIRKLGKKIPTLEKVGTCRLDADFIRVWNELRSAGSGSTETGSSHP